MHRALQRQDWASFARAYNGPGYAQNNYDTKIAAEYNRLSRQLKVWCSRWVGQWLEDRLDH
ncbi:MAG: N-acetylmuramidase family protein [Rubrivivax sp.]|nr:N-acetylmuramidase family protein [Rubrivivax sp.]